MYNKAGGVDSLQSRILSTLAAHPEGLTILEMSSILGIHRHTAIKYLMELKGAQLIIQRPVGSAFLHYLNPNVNPKFNPNINPKNPDSPAKNIAARRRIVYA